MNLFKKNLLIPFYLFIIFSLSLVCLVDTDAFTHLSLGREIFNHRGLPAKELFNYPSLDYAFSNSEWLFGLVLYIVYLLLNIKGVILLKAGIITLTFYILLKDSSYEPPSTLSPPIKGGEIPSPLAGEGRVRGIAVLFVTALFMRYRFVERPDIALMLFLAFNIYSLNTFVQEGKPYLYFLPIVQGLWANIHPSVSLMAIPFIAFIAGEIG